MAPAGFLGVVPPTVSADAGRGARPPAVLRTVLKNACDVGQVKLGAPNKVVAEMHDRMPVILEAKDFVQWEHGDVNDATALMKPADDELLQKWPVSKRVNSSKAPDDDPTLIERSDGVVDQAALVDACRRAQDGEYRVG